MHKSFKKFGLFSKKESKLSDLSSIGDKNKVVLSKKNVYRILRQIGETPHQPIAKEKQSKKSSQIKNADKRETQSQSSKGNRHESCRVTKQDPRPRKKDDTDFFFISPSAIKNERKKAKKLKPLDTNEKPRHRSTSPTYTKRDNHRKTSSPHSLKPQKDSKSSKSDDPNWLSKKEIFNLINNSKKISHNTIDSNSLKKYFVFDQPSSGSGNQNHRHSLKPSEGNRTREKKSKEKRPDMREILKDPSNVSSFKSYIMGVLDKNLTEMLKPSDETSRSYREKIPVDIMYSRSTGRKDRDKNRHKRPGEPSSKERSCNSYDEERSPARLSKRIDNEEVSKKTRKKLTRDEIEDILFYNAKSRKDTLTLEHQQSSVQLKKKKKKRCRSIQVDAATEPEKREFSKPTLKSQMLEVCQKLSEGTLEKLKKFKEPQAKEIDYKKKLSHTTLDKLRKITEPNKDVPKNCDDKLYKKLQQVEKRSVVTAGCNFAETGASKNVKSSRRPRLTSEFRPKLVEKLLQVIEIAPEEPILTPNKSKSRSRMASRVGQKLVENLIPIIEIPPVLSTNEDPIEKKKKSSTFRNYYKYDHANANTKSLTLSSASDSNRIYPGVSDQSVFSDKSSASGATPKTRRKSRRDTPRSRIPVLHPSKFEKLPSNSKVTTKRIWARASSNFRSSSIESNYGRISRGNSARGVKTTTTDCKIIESGKAISECRSNKPSTTTCDSVTTASSIPEDVVSPEIKTVTCKLSQITSESLERPEAEKSKTVSKIPQWKENKLKAKTKILGASPQRGGGGSTSNSVSLDLPLDSPKNTTTMLLTKNFRDDDKVSRYHKWKMYGEQVRKKLLQQPQNLNSIPPQVMEVRFLTVTQNDAFLYDDLEIHSSCENSPEIEFYQEKKKDFDEAGGDSRSTFTKSPENRGSLKLQIEELEPDDDDEGSCGNREVKRVYGDYDQKHRSKKRRSNLSKIPCGNDIQTNRGELAKKNKDKGVMEDSYEIEDDLTKKEYCKNFKNLGDVALKKTRRKHESRFRSSQAPTNRALQPQIEELARTGKKDLVEEKPNREEICCGSSQKKPCNMITTEMNFIRKHENQLSQFKDNTRGTKAELKDEIGDDGQDKERLWFDFKMKEEINETRRKKTKYKKASKVEKLQNVSGDVDHSKGPKLRKRSENFSGSEEKIVENAIKLIPQEQFSELFELPLDDALNEILSENFHFLNKDFSYSAITPVFESNLEADFDQKSTDSKSCRNKTKATKSDDFSWHEFYSKDSTKDICYEEGFHNLKHKEHDIILSSVNQEIADFCSAPGSEESGYATIESGNFFQRPEIKMLLEPPLCSTFLHQDNSSSISTVDCISFKTFLNSSSNFSIGTNLSGNLPRVISFSSESEQSSDEKNITKLDNCNTCREPSEKHNSVKREVSNKSIKEEEKINKPCLKELEEMVSKSWKEIAVVSDEQISKYSVGPKAKKKKIRKFRFFRFFASFVSRNPIFSCIKSCKKNTQ